MQGLPFGPQNMPYYGAQPQFMQQQPPSIPVPPAVQTPVQQAAQQPQQGDIWSDLSTFSRTPQGQQALLAFANAAMQNSMNPQTGGGAGFINAVGSGMQGYKAADEYQDRKARRKKDETFEDEMNPLRKKYLEGQIAEQGKEETPYKFNQEVTIHYEDDSGKPVEEIRVFKGIDPKTKDNIWHVKEKHVGKGPQPKEAKSLDMLNYQEIAAGIVKHPSITPEKAQSLLDQMARSPYGKRQAATQMALKDDRWYQTEGNSVARNSLIDEYESYITPVKNPGIVDVTGERAKATAAIAAAKGNATAIANIKAAYRAKTGQELK